MVRTPLFHGVDTGSNPVRDKILMKKNIKIFWEKIVNFFWIWQFIISPTFPEIFWRLKYICISILFLNYYYYLKINIVLYYISIFLWKITETDHFIINNFEDFFYFYFYFVNCIVFLTYIPFFYWNFFFLFWEGFFLHELFFLLQFFFLILFWLFITIFFFYKISLPLYILFFFNLNHFQSNFFFIEYDAQFIIYFKSVLSILFKNLIIFFIPCIYLLFIKLKKCIINLWFLEKKIFYIFNSFFAIFLTNDFFISIFFWILFIIIYEFFFFYVLWNEEKYTSK